MKTTATILKLLIAILGTVGLFAWTLYRTGLVPEMSWGLYLDVFLVWASVCVIAAGMGRALGFKQ